MRRTLNYLCQDHEVVATLDEGAKTAGLLIVAGGNETRTGAHRGMAKLAGALANRDYPVFRFDRRGAGDSDGPNGGYASSGPDIRAAVAAFRAAAPQVARIVGLGNCDAATALAIHRGDAAIDALVLANPWIVPPIDDLPPKAAIKDRYARRLRDPAAWAALLTGKIDMRALGRGLGRLALPKKEVNLASSFAAALTTSKIPTDIVLATRDGTAASFADTWKGEAFGAARHDAAIAVTRLDSASHSFASAGDFDALLAIILRRLETLA